MWRTTKLLIMLGIVATTLAGCASSTVQHAPLVVQGHVLGPSDHAVLIDVGSADHVTIGDEFVAYRVTRFGDPAYKGKPHYSERRSGSIRIDEILTAHSARATLVDGLASTGEMVEFRHSR
ncbi:hypothetical protein [Dyella tabacisoli]|uniref:Uncharacterized protein n=1 Tax=Dyella tabacisoli TaxID=2282381 RepID=A0A369ULT7_9GAMM|nr:hypothetical protein [Dyella tabacisoli]RDD81714.1 hypothetical protein DVJ77_11160 [Dyella tabacisoli]